MAAEEQAGAGGSRRDVEPEGHAREPVETAVLEAAALVDDWIADRRDVAPSVRFRPSSVTRGEWRSLPRAVP
jgi:hypothetical protein